MSDNSKITEILVDMDGVLCNFAKRYRQLYHTDPEIDYYSSNKKKKERHQKLFDEFVKSQQFADLEPMPDFKEGLEFLIKIHKDYQIPISILSSVAKEDYIKDLSTQKRFWLKKHNVPFFPVFVPGKRFKHYYSKPGRILIDDIKSTIDNWESMGGIGIHHKSWKETINIIKTHL